MHTIKTAKIGISTTGLCSTETRRVKNSQTTISLSSIKPANQPGLFFFDLLLFGSSNFAKLLFVQICISAKRSFALNKKLDLQIPRLVQTSFLSFCFSKIFVEVTNDSIQTILCCTKHISQLLELFQICIFLFSVSLLRQTKKDFLPCLGATTG